VPCWGRRGERDAAGAVARRLVQRAYGTGEPGAAREVDGDAHPLLEVGELLEGFAIQGTWAIGYARGEAPLGYAPPGDDPVIEYDEDVLAALEQGDDFA
jgi:hypothetical protein